MTESNPHALTGAYALDALDGEELAAFQAHLAQCDSCPIEVAELQATVTRLSALLERTPPASLRDRVLQAANQTAQLPPPPVSLHDRRDLGRRSSDRVSLEQPHSERSGPRRKRVLAVAGGALAAAAAAAGALFVVNLNDVPSAEEIMAAADTVTLPAETLDGRDAGATMHLSASLDAAVITASDMPPPEDGQTYQAWIFEGDTPKPAATFEPAADGQIVAVIRDADGATGYGVTVEPDGGSPTGLPSTPAVMLFDPAAA